MAADKLVDSAQLDADLATIANAIRAKGGTSADLAFPADFVTAIGNISGGGGGLEYETGTWKPGSDIAKGTVNFSKSHPEAPFFILMSDATGTGSSATNSNHLFGYVDPYKLFGAGFPYTSSGFRYGAAFYVYRASSTSSTTFASVTFQYNSDSSGTSSTGYPRYWATESVFHPYSNSTSRYWRAGRTYKWIAVWKP